MDMKNINTFIYTAELGSFTKAAELLGYSQSTVSFQIRQLEEELGTPLFVRTTCRVEPTQAGQLFAEFAQSTRKGYEAFQAALAAGQRQREKLVLQVPATMAARDPLYHDLLLALSRELPDCDLEVVTDSTFRPPEEVLQSGVDALVQLLAEPVGSAVDVMSLFDTRCYLLASPNNPLSAESFLTPPQLTGQTVCFESCDAVFVSIVRRCMEEVPMRWLMVPSFEKEYVRMLAGKCLFFSPVRGHGSPREWFHALMFPFPPMPTCLFTRRGDTRPEIQTLKALALAEHARAVEDGRL